MKGGIEVSSRIEVQVCCEASMERSGTKYTSGEGWSDHYVCLVCRSDKWIKIGDAKK